MRLDGEWERRLSDIQKEHDETAHETPDAGLRTSPSNADLTRSAN